jgi:hypothetical protein
MVTITTLFTAIWTAGRSMSLEEAIDYALGNTHLD